MFTKISKTMNKKKKKDTHKKGETKDSIDSFDCSLNNFYYYHKLFSYKQSFEIYKKSHKEKKYRRYFLFSLENLEYVLYSSQIFNGSFILKIGDYSINIFNLRGEMNLVYT